MLCYDERFGAAPSADEMVRGGAAVPTPPPSGGAAEAALAQALVTAPTTTAEVPCCTCPGASWAWILVAFAVGYIVRRK